MLGFLNSKLFTYLAFFTFSNVGVERTIILKKEIESLPLIISDELEICVNKILENPTDYELQKRIDEIIFNLIPLNELEKEQINYLHDVIIPLYNDENVFYKINDNQLLDYINIFFDTFKHYFNKEKGEILHAKCYLSQQFIGVEIIISPEPDNIITFKQENISV